MIIQVDEAGRDAIQQLCDIALKHAGMRNLNQVNVILRSAVLLPEAKNNPNPKDLGEARKE